MFWFFGRKACGILAPRPEIEPTPRPLEGEVLTTGPPGKSLLIPVLRHLFMKIFLKPGYIDRNIVIQQYNLCWVHQSQLNKYWIHQLNKSI